MVSVPAFSPSFVFLDLFVIAVGLVFVCVRFGLSRTLRIICRLLAFAFYNGVVIPEFLAVFVFLWLLCALAPVSSGAQLGNARVQMVIVCVFGYVRVGW